MSGYPQRPGQGYPGQGWPGPQAGGAPNQPTGGPPQQPPGPAPARPGYAPPGAAPPLAPGQPRTAPMRGPPGMPPGGPASGPPRPGSVPPGVPARPGMPPGGPGFPRPGGMPPGSAPMPARPGMPTAMSAPGNKPPGSGPMPARPGMPQPMGAPLGGLPRPAGMPPGGAPSQRPGMPPQRPPGQFPGVGGPPGVSQPPGPPSSSLGRTPGAAPGGPVGGPPGRPPFMGPPPASRPGMPGGPPPSSMAMPPGPPQSRPEAPPTPFGSMPGPPRPGLMPPGGPQPMQPMARRPSMQPGPPALGGLPAAPPGSFGMAQGPVDASRQQQLLEQLESLALGPEAPGQADATDPAAFPRPLLSADDGGVSERALLAPPGSHAPGSCDPRIMRCSLAAVPGSHSLKASWHIPMALICQPMLDTPEAPVPVVDGTQKDFIIRCTHCRSYVSPFAQWTNGGRHFRCVMCGNASEVAPAAFVPTDHSGLRQDHGQRAELNCGSVEYVAPEDYTVRPPMPPCFFFVIDVTQAAVQSGALRTVCAGIKACLDHLSQEALTRVGFLTYDNSLHFYSLNPNLPAPQMMVVADLDDPFPPLPDDHFVNLDSSRAQIDKLLDVLPDMFADTTCVEAALGPALQAAFRTINHLGGKLMLFMSSAAALGCGKIKQREQPALYNTEREPTLRSAADPFYKQFTGECLHKQITVDIFAMASVYCDLFSLDLLPRYTAGALYHYPAFHAARDGEKLAKELERNLTRKQGWEAVMRVRCSKGLRISTFHGHVFVRQNDLLALPTVNEDDTFVAQISLDDTVLSGEDAYVQCAVLYTASNSERRIRVHTLKLPIAQTQHDLYDAADGLANAALLAKLAVEKSFKSRLDETRAAVVKKFTAQLKDYKSMHAQQRAPSRLLYPRSLRHAIPWLHGMLRLDALRGGSDVDPDVRCGVTSLTMIAPIDLMAVMAYPAVFKLHAGGWGGRGENGALQLPPTVPASLTQLEPHGAYLVDAGRVAFLWLGRNASVQLIEDLFGKEGSQAAAQGNFQHLASLSVEPARPGSNLSDCVQALLAERRRNRPVWPLCYTAAQSTQLEGYMALFMVEDAAAATAPAYRDFLMQLYKGISLR